MVYELQTGNGINDHWILCFLHHGAWRLEDGRTHYGTVPARRGTDAYLQRLGRRVRELRRSRKWTQEELAHRTERTTAYISRIETGQQNPSILTVRSLAKAFDVSVNDLLPE